MPFLIPCITSSPFIIFCPHILKTPYHLFAHILLLQHITYPLWSIYIYMCRTEIIKLHLVLAEFPSLISDDTLMNFARIFFLDLAGKKSDDLYERVTVCFFSTLNANHIRRNRPHYAQCKIVDAYWTSSHRLANETGE